MWAIDVDAKCDTVDSRLRSRVSDRCCYQIKTVDSNVKVQ